MTIPLTPYDTGARCEPKIWSHSTAVALAGATGRTLEDELDRFGRVDFENDESATMVTVHVESTETGHRIVIDSQIDPEDLEIIVDGLRHAPAAPAPGPVSGLDR